MTHEAVPLLDAAAARRGDTAAVEAGGTWAGLMERAAGHLARGVVELAGHAYGLKVAVVVGKGNNGGDGWAAARRLERLGASCWVLAVHGLDVEMSAEASANRARYRGAGGRADGPGELARALDWADVAVDCLLGTGTTGAPREPVASAAAALNAAPIPVVACDIPSGVSSDDGSAPEGAVRADLTVTFGGWKRGLVLHPGAAYAGRVLVGDLGPAYVPPDVAWSALTAAGAAPIPLAADADKRARGRVLVVAGSDRMPGAAVLAARGAVAGGAGLITVAGVGAARHAVASQLPEAMTIGLPDDDGWIAADAVSLVLDACADVDVVVAGPGLGHGKGAAAVVAALRGVDLPTVFDADALNVHRDDPSALADHAGPLVLTPHDRELERIGGGPVPDRAVDLGAVIVAKGPGTVIAAPDGRVWVNPTGGPSLGAGGTGDLLAGLIAAVIAAHPDDVAIAAARATWWHGLAGDLAGVDVADRSGSARVAAVLPTALGHARELARHRPAWPFDGDAR